MINLDDNRKRPPLEEETSSFVEAIRKFKQSFEIDIPNQHKVLYDELAKAGWYIDYNLEPKTLADLILLDYEKMSYLDQHLIDYFQKQSSLISKKIQRLYPDRKKFINSAFKAHKRKEYELSIPVFLAQIDGICYELIEKDFFSISPRSEKNKEQPKHWIVNQQFDNFKSSILEPLTKNEYLSVQIKNRHKYPFALNRNEVLHGRCIDYATKLNSLKAVSLLNYISVIVADIKFDRGITWD